MPKEYGVSDGIISEAEGLGYKALTADDWSTLTGADVPADIARALNILAAVGASSSDPNAIHDNVSGEISAITEKVSPASGDHLLIEDSAASNAKKRVQVGNLPGGGGGETNTASNVGTAGVGVFKQKAGVDLEFKKINAGSNAVTITDDTGNNEIDIDVVTGRCFFTAATGAGTIINKTYEANTVPANKRLTAFESDNDDITVTIEIHTTGDGYMPDDVKVSGGGATPVTVTKGNFSQLVTDGRVWTADVRLTDADTTDPLTATLPAAGGDTSTCDYTRALDPPDITAAAFDTHADTTGGDPLVQDAQNETTSVQGGTQTVRITGTCDAHATRLWVKNAGISNGEQGPYTISGGTFDIVANVRSSGNTGAQTATVECAVGTGGTRGSSMATSNTVTISHTLPTFTGGSQGDIAYPGSQEALKDAETCTVTVTHTNIDGADTYLYDDNSTSELTIPNLTTYQAAKASVARASGSYRESSTNYRLTVTRPARNGTAATKSVTVKIAHVSPVVTVTGTTNRLGTDDGTNSYQDHTITLTSSQANLSTHTPSLAADGGDSATGWQGSWSTSGNLAYTRSYRVQDAAMLAGGQAANNFTWGACSIKNRAGKEATSVTTNTTYSLGGFQERNFFHPVAPAHEIDIGILIVDTSKVTVENVAKGADQVFEASIQHREDADPDNNNFFTISDNADSYDPDNQYYHNNDKKFADTVSSPTSSIFRIAETT